MIVSTDRSPGIVIATPCKTGTMSWKKMAQETNGLDWVLPQHSVLKPIGMEDAKAYITVRDPYWRLVSQYKFVGNKNRHTEWGHVAASTMTFGKYVEWFFEKKNEADEIDWWDGDAPWRWTKSLTQCAESVEAVDFLKLEDAQKEMERFLKTEGFPDGPEVMYHRNSLAQHRESDNILYYYRSKKTIELVDEMWAKEDCKSFGYQRLRRAS